MNPWTYVYDAENRITTAGSTSYTYDADGRRVKKSSGTNYWYGPTGAVLAETDASGAWTNYIFFAGQRLARNVPQAAPNPPDIKYYISDHLHSTGMFVDQSGTVLDNNDFYPWGGVVPGVGQTTSNNTIKFTGQYRDTESQLDYFGARYYANITGRFMSPDWAAKPVTVPYAKFGDPQSLNLYGYVENSPINRVDADGHSYLGMADGMMTASHEGHGMETLGEPPDDRYDVTTTTTTTTMTFSDGTSQTFTQTEITVQQVGSSQPIASGYSSATTRSISVYERQKIGSFLPKAVLDSAKINIGKTPHWGPIFFPLGKDFLGLTINNNVFLSKSYDPSSVDWLATLAHELFHVHQYRTKEMTVMGYLLEARKHGSGRANKYEAPAYDFEEGVKRQLTAVGRAWDGTLIMPRGEQ